MDPWCLTSHALHEPWRLWTCHLAHQDWQHALDNGLALAVPLLVLRSRERARVALWLFLLAPLLGLALLPSLQGGTYCGISGLACAAWALVGLQLAVREDAFPVGIGLLGLLALKFSVESLTGAGLIQHSGRWQTLSESHLYGALLGLGAGMAEETLLRLRSKAVDSLRRVVTIPR